MNVIHVGVGKGLKDTPVTVCRGRVSDTHIQLRDSDVQDEIVKVYGTVVKKVSVEVPHAEIGPLESEHT